MFKIIGQEFLKTIGKFITFELFTAYLNIIFIAIVMPQAFFSIGVFFALHFFVLEKATGLSILALGFSNPRGATLTSRVA
jgi:hypothetical protein